MLVKEIFNKKYPRKSWWKPLCFIVPLYVAFLIVQGYGLQHISQELLSGPQDKWGTELTFKNGQLFYVPPVTEAEAKRLGEYLVNNVFFDGDKKSVQIKRKDKTYQFRMVVKKGIEQDQHYIDIFRLFGSELSENVFKGEKVDFELCDDNFNTIRVVPQSNNIGKELNFNGSQLFYMPQVTEAEAKRLGQYLVDIGFFDDEEKSVQIKRKDKTYQFRMVAKKGIERDPAVITGLKEFCTQLSENVFNNAPIEIHICDDYFETIQVVMPL